MRLSWQLLDQGTLRDIALVCLADGIVGISFGAIATSGGLPAYVPILLSMFVFAGGSQFAALGVVLAGGSPLAAVATALLLNTRLIPYGFAIHDALGSKWWTRMIGAHLVTDESVAFAIQQSEPNKRRAALWVCGVALFACWNLPVALGAFLGKAIGDPGAFGLDAAFPTVLIALVLPSLSSSRIRKRASLGTLVAISTAPFIAAGIPVLLSLFALLLPVRELNEDNGPRGGAS